MLSKAIKIAGCIYLACSICYFLLVLSSFPAILCLSPFLLCPYGAYRGTLWQRARWAQHYLLVGRMWPWTIFLLWVSSVCLAPFLATSNSRPAASFLYDKTAQIILGIMLKSLRLRTYPQTAITFLQRGLYLLYPIENLTWTVVCQTSCQKLQ